MDIFATETAQAAEREEAQRIAAQHRAEAVKLLMENRSGRIFVRDFLTFCGVFASPSLKSTEQLHFSEGLRLAGMYLYAALAKENPQNITTILTEDA